MTQQHSSTKHSYKTIFQSAALNLKKKIIYPIKEKLVQVNLCLLAKVECGPLSGPSKVIAESEKYQKT